MNYGLEMNSKILQWNESSFKSIYTLKEEYTKLVSKKFGQELANISTLADLKNFENLSFMISTSSNEDVAEIAMAPETGNFLFFQKFRNADFLAYLNRAFEAIQTRSTPFVESLTDLWSPNGDYYYLTTNNPSFLFPQGLGTGHFQAPKALGIPIDFVTPNATRISLERGHPQDSYTKMKENIRSNSISFFDDAEKSTLVKTIEKVLLKIRKASPWVFGFLNEHISYIVVRKDIENPHLFTSGTDGQFVGRVCLINLDAKGVDEAIIADALVHEAIHGLLYRQERLDAWVSCKKVYLGDCDCKASPWTGSDLTPRQFMQACFVWFGLAKFWRLPKINDAFGKERAEFLGEFARDGFFAEHLNEFNSSWGGKVHDHVKSAIFDLQKFIVLDEQVASKRA